MMLPAIALALAAGCQTRQRVDDTPAGPDYGRQLAPGESALRLITDPARMPHLAGAFRDYRDANEPFLRNAIDQSKKWFLAPSSRQFFPFDVPGASSGGAIPGGGITHDQAHASLHAFEHLLVESADAASFVADVQRMFNIYESVGYNSEGIVLYTGYYAPEFRASRTRGGAFQYPLYKRPDDLVTDPVTGDPLGRRMPDGTLAPWPTRREIEQSNMFAGSELVWLDDPLSVYIIHVNGSAKLKLEDGDIMYVGYGGKTDRPYGSLGQAIIEAGLAERANMSLARIKQLYRRHPDRIMELTYANESYVFFTEYAGGNWPAGSLGVRVTEQTSLATDKRIYPRGGLVLVDTQTVTFSQGHRAFLRFMLDQDAGGAIRAPGRADIFMGIGPSAEILAGGQYAEGRLYYLFLREDYVDEFLPDDTDVARR